jgi:serine O-acetyltransferase
VGIPAHIVKRNGVKVNPCDDLDQVDIPDPVENEISALKARIDALEKKLSSED